MSDKPSSGMDEKTASILCYVLWWVTGIVFLLIEQNNKNVRFHAFQSIIIFGAISVAQIILSFIPWVGWILGIFVWLGSVILWIMLMVKASQGQKWKVKWAGDLAEKWAEGSGS